MIIITQFFLFVRIGEKISTESVHNNFFFLKYKNEEIVAEN